MALNYTVPSDDSQEYTVKRKKGKFMAIEVKNTFFHPQHTKEVF